MGEFREAVMRTMGRRVKTPMENKKKTKSLSDSGVGHDDRYTDTNTHTQMIGGLKRVMPLNLMLS